MSEQENTERTTADLPLPPATWGRAEVITECAGVTSVIASYSPPRDWSYGPDDRYSSTIPADIAVRVGDLRISLEPHVWAVVIAAVQQVAPVTEQVTA